MAMAQLGRIGGAIKAKLEFLNPLFLEILNESHKHNVPPNSESHFKVVIVSSEFEGKSLIQRHRAVNNILKEELQTIHALSIIAKTPSQWEDNSLIPKSPPCLGGSKAEAVAVAAGGGVSPSEAPP